MTQKIPRGHVDKVQIHCTIWTPCSQAFLSLERETPKLYGGPTLLAPTRCEKGAGIHDRQQGTGHIPQRWINGASTHSWAHCIWGRDNQTEITAHHEDLGIGLAEPCNHAGCVHFVRVYDASWVVWMGQTKRQKRTSFVFNENMFVTLKTFHRYIRQG
jgi:hypothetical protein